MASAEEVNLNDSHPPHPNAIEAFEKVISHIKSAIVRSRHDWDKVVIVSFAHGREQHEPRMWSRAHGVDDHQLTTFDISKDLVLIRSGSVSYGTIIFGKLRIPAINDSEGEGFIHIRIHDPPNRGTQDVVFHSIFTEEGNRNADGHPTTWRAIHTKDTPLEFFNE
ncbi:hypothetical protein Clacol_000539 [Clathrus columnatus]|uniref:Uncharacterized protein n=1 Tax=Clathrus columnatus TaxID=1419009 RepID=A0AAV4ZYR7_9AGAM|nr:hypothetical protein Clacol_000539 [Clathrus columnatus]